MWLPGCLTFVCVVDAKATAQVDDLDVHEMFMVSRKHLQQQYQSRDYFASHLLDVTMQGGKNWHIHEGAAKVDMDTHDYNPTQHGMIAVKLA